MATGDLTTLENAKEWLGLTGLQVSAITNASPAVLTLGTQPGTPLLSGVAYVIAGARGMALPNDAYVVTVLSPTTFSIPFDSTLAGTYTGGATVGITDPLVQRLISATSAYIQNYLNRTIASNTYTRNFNGQNTDSMMLPQYPVTAINSLYADGVAITERAALTSPSINGYGFGYTFQETGQVGLTGWLFPRGYNNVSVSWVGGYLISDEAQTIPASAPYECVTLARWSAGDRGVTYASDGVAFVAVSSAPAQGQYSVDGSVYTFNAADAGVDVLISYAYVPYDVEQACVDCMGDWFRYRDRIGVTSKSIDGQSISLTNFVNKSLPARAQGVLDQYKRVAPII
jgi:hypothetical protein